MTVSEAIRRRVELSLETNKLAREIETKSAELEIKASEIESISQFIVRNSPAPVKWLGIEEVA